MRAIIGLHRASVWLVLAVTCGILAGRSECRGDNEPDGGSISLGGSLAGSIVVTSEATAGTASKADQQKKSQESMQNALQEAQAAYEKEQRELKERLDKNPLWQPSHQNVAVIKPGKGPIESFCRNKEGNLLICCSGAEPSILGSIFGANSTPQNGVIAVLSPEGEKIADWKMPLNPQAICQGGDGAIYVAGGGRVAKLDQSGKVLAQGDAPNVGELPPLPVVKKEPKKEGPEAEAADKAKREKIADLTKQMQDAQCDYMKVATEAQKNLKPNDDESMQAFQEKVKGPMEKRQAAQQDLQQLTQTPQMRLAQAKLMRQQLATVTGMAVTDRDLFLCCASAKGFGYTVWRSDHDFANAKKIVENLAGCCGQMDIQAHGGDLWVAHNSRHKVEHYSRDGKKLGSFGKTDRISADGFGGCCEPKNLRFGPDDVVFACESGPPTCVKRFSLSGKFLGVSLVAPWSSGCVRVTTEYDAEHDRYFVLNSGDQQIHVFAKKAGAKGPPATASLTTDKAAN